MRKYRFIIEMRDGRTYGLYAFNNLDAGILVHAWCICKGLSYDMKSWDIDTNVHSTEDLEFDKRYNAATKPYLYTEVHSDGI